MNHQVFISYSSKNLIVAQAACHVIEQSGYRCWMAPRDITPGYSYADLIDEAIQNCDVFVLIFSKSSSISKWVRSELNIAFERQAHIIPFRVDDTPLEGANRLILNQTHWIDAYPQYESKLNDLVESIGMVLSDKRSDEVKNRLQNDKRLKLRPIYVVLSIVLSVIVSLVYIFLIDSKGYSYNYDNGNLSVTSDNIGKKQAPIIDQILDAMVYVDGGTFVMGNTEKGDSLWIEADKESMTRHNVTLSGFYISKYELTQEQWLSLTGDYSMLSNLSPQNPVDYLSWEAANQLAEKLKEMTGLPFSLPTEAQWEYAAKGGEKSLGYIYAGADVADPVAWVSSFDTLVHRVGLLEPNELGLYDMTGNVSEWCMDYYGEYENKDIDNPTGPNMGKLRTFRGGNIDSDIYNSKVTIRGKAFPNYSRKFTGVRLVINQQSNE